MFDAPRYWLRNAHVPLSLIVGGSNWVTGKRPADNLLLVDIEIEAGMIAAITAAGAFSSYSVPSIDLNQGIVWPCLVDMHTHLDKGHMWERAPNPNGLFETALKVVKRDASKRWTAEDVYRRIEFGLKCSYAHGTKAIRTHIDSAGKLGPMSFEVFDELRSVWADRIDLQAVALVTLDNYLKRNGKKIANLVAEKGGVLGGVAFMNPDIEPQIDRTFELAKERELDLDFHVDENDDPDSQCLKLVAEAAIKHKFKGRITCGHCCSLAVQPEAAVKTTIKLLKKAGIGVVSLPMCNLYLQGRTPKQTPSWRGVTLLHELKAAGVPVAIASDNCRDPFFGFGDHDGLEVFNQSARIAHLDRPYGDWVNAITSTPADLMGLPGVGRIGVGLPADLVLFKARHFSELLSRSQHDRIVLRDGVAIDTTLPDYAELDDLLS
ncbi:cytosine deaminase [filamentous cyanobacterium LEGE 11480]|uniref:Cytosine deaminase n=1 Tax=Romeriopsis navalis LEGE 11480 TaxID=2777977 RepID=A0A928VQF2_9CYAN|nr:cytosine deaminase [Romeriopsis navalis]MBE9031898.1 cytosine deaminase [Romeriopsis navalis LEGE 11480]